MTDLLSFHTAASKKVNILPYEINFFLSMNKPVVRFETTLSVNLYQIKEVFEKICKKRYFKPSCWRVLTNVYRGFEIVDDEGDQITAVNKKTANWKDLLFSCIPSSSKSYQNLTAIRLHSKTNKITCIRRITLKALLGVINSRMGFWN